MQRFEFLLFNLMERFSSPVKLQPFNVNEDHGNFYYIQESNM